MAALIVLLAATSVQAISSGPGGRLYTTSRGAANVDCITLKSFVIASNWDNSGMTSHGTIYDGWTYARHPHYGISPEVENPGQAPGYANLVMGVFYDCAPVSAYASPAQTLDVDGALFGGSGGVRIWDPGNRRGGAPLSP